jgi:heptosyltransferase-2
MTSKQTLKIWVRATNWVGDALLTIPALEALRLAYPEAEITLAARPWVRELFLDWPTVDRLQVYDRQKLHHGWRGRARFISEIAAQKFDMAILLPNSFETAFLAWKAGIPARIGYATDGRGWMLTKRLKVRPDILEQHQTAYYLDMLRQAGIIREIPQIKCITLPVSEKRREEAMGFLRDRRVSQRGPWIGLNPGAFFGSAKRWLSDRYAALADRLVDALGGDVLIFGSAAERRMAEEIARSMRRSPRIFSGETTLSQLAALLKCCALVVTNDSGPMHLSAAVGARTLAIFGPTDERATAPLAPHARILKHPVSCSPCLLRACPLDHRCMTRITVDEVFDAAMEMLK